MMDGTEFEVGYYLTTHISNSTKITMTIHSALDPIEDRKNLRVVLPSKYAETKMRFYDKVSITFIGSSILKLYMMGIKI